jgi:hypothetical protein
VPQKKQGLWIYVYFALYRGAIQKDQRLKHLYDTIYTIGNYSGFYSSLRDIIGGNGGNFEFHQKMEKNYDIHHVFMISI